jgi:hypothetical protein
VIEVRIPHSLSRDDANKRFESLAHKKGIAIEVARDGFHGTISKTVPFLGSAKAEYEVESGAVTVRVLEAPAFVSEATMRRMLEDELGRVLA